ncbi:hypothetical protein [uncultured Bacteroides sp.]|uniref:hypothetical protein n=1 Tax=uncultured Bacteroides sp. TaxID=162156 RepID=UPI0027D944FC|nr:hypothetical protein [uncultured Bacteroides sp.]
MKKILFLLSFILYNLSVLGQTTFSYTKYLNGYWDDQWKSAHEIWGRSLISGYVMKGTYDDFIIYISGNTPADFTTHLKIDKLNLNIDKKEKKRRLKENQWYEYTGVLECYFDKDITSVEKWLRRFPTVPTPNWPDIKKQTISVTVLIAPYKKTPETYNIIINNNLRLGISLK